MTRSSVRILATIFLGLFWLVASPTAQAEAAAKYAALILDADTGTILFERQAAAERHPASLTKIMTLYMLFDAIESGKISLNQRLKVSARAAGQAPSKLGLQPGDSIRAKDAILALVTKSANDVAVVVAEALGETEVRFARLMTDKARRLGMRNTTFRNASGLHHPKQISTAFDMAMLALAIRRDFPKEYAYFSTRSFHWNGRQYGNHNKLLGHYEGTDGIKTGYIGASGFNLVASVERNGRRLIGVVFGGRSGPLRDRHMKRLLTSGFEKVDEIRVAHIVPPLPHPRPEREVQLASIETVSVDSTNPVHALVQVAPEVESGSRDEGAEWGIQVGAYATEIRAQRSIALARGHLTDLLTGTDVLVEPLDRKSGTIYRARLFGLSEEEARTACLSLKRKQLPCVPVPGQTEITMASGSKKG
ncbi:D-alanyl-D-alanine carboxypeptidase [Thalassobaculum sp.]|uniref:D-alanyl-D-alanine carboxypeptidase n=1 Tax=Thalassobaculum sp. TaxID=2022740 RepID=UPI0032EB1DB6